MSFSGESANSSEKSRGFRSNLEYRSQKYDRIQYTPKHNRRYSGSRQDSVEDNYFPMTKRRLFTQVQEVGEDSSSEAEVEPTQMEIDEWNNLEGKIF